MMPKDGQSKYVDIKTGISTNRDSEFSASVDSGDFIEEKPIKQEKIEPRVEPVTPRNKTGRNDFCPCGSKKKYKKCCLKIVEEMNT